MPNLPRPEKKAYKTTSRDDRKPTNQAFYNSLKWRKASMYHRSQNPLCEVSEAAGLVVPGEVCDHIIPINVGGAKFDSRNFMTLSKAIHDIKSGLESHTSPLIAWDYNDYGDKVPQDRQMIIEKLIKFVK